MLTEAQFNEPIKENKDSNSTELQEEKVKYRNNYALRHSKWILLQWKEVEDKTNSENTYQIVFKEN